MRTINGSRLDRLNDNIPKLKGDLNDWPISAEDWRHPPRVEVEPDARWFCLVTVPQQEYRCLDGLTEAGVVGYVPTETRWVKRRKGAELRNTQIQAPIFRGYCFARIAHGSHWEPVQRRDAFRRSPIGVLGVIGAHGAPVPIYAGKLRSLAEEEREGWFDDRRRPNLIAGRDAVPAPAVMAGECVRIVGGAFAGREGVAENDNVRGEVRVWAELFGGRTLMTIPLADIENVTRVAEAALRRA